MGDLAMAAETAEELRAAIGPIVRRLRRESGMPVPHVAALRWLDLEGPMTTSALAACERIRPQSMAATLLALRLAGFAERADDPDDGRQVLWSISAEGGRALTVERRRRARWLVGAIAELDDEEAKQLREAARVMRKIMDGAG